MKFDLFNTKPRCLLFCNRQKQNRKKKKLEPSRMKMLWFSIDLFLLQAKLLQALNGRSIALLFVSYLFPEAKRSQRTFKWALQPFMVLQIKTPGTNEKHVSAGCRPHVSVSRICSAFKHFCMIITLNKQGFCHSWMLCFRLFAACGEIHSKQAVCSSGTHRHWKEAGEKLKERSTPKSVSKIIGALFAECKTFLGDVMALNPSPEMFRCQAGVTVLFVLQQFGRQAVMTQQGGFHQPSKITCSDISLVLVVLKLCRALWPVPALWHHHSRPTSKQRKWWRPKMELKPDWTLNLFSSGGYKHGSK